MQVGLNGVDNGAIRFTNVRVPRENLLDRFASGKPLLRVLPLLPVVPAQGSSTVLSQRAAVRASPQCATSQEHALPGFFEPAAHPTRTPSPPPSLRPVLSCGTVDRSGRYSSPMTSATKRFAATLGELTGGRVGLTCASGERRGVACTSMCGVGWEQASLFIICTFCCLLAGWLLASGAHSRPVRLPARAAAVGVLKGALTIAIRYGAQRQQFGPADGPEVSVLDYPSQQQKLMPMLATCYALNFVKNRLVEK